MNPDKEIYIDPHLLALFRRCGTFESVIKEILVNYNCGNGCKLCELGSCYYDDNFDERNYNESKCARALAEHFKRMEDE